MVRSRATPLSIAVIVVTTLGSLALWPRLPAEMAIHFSAGGTPDSFVPKAVGVPLLPVMMVLTLLGMRWAMRFDPPEDPGVGQVATVATVGLLGVLQALVLAWNLGYPVPFDLVLVGVVGWAVALSGYAIRREGLSLG